MKNFVLIAALLSVGACRAAFAQGDATISRVGDLQLGGGYTSANSDYLTNRINGYALYGDFDFREHFGVEVDFHDVSAPTTTHLYERTYEVGGRYLRHYGRFTPYAKVMVGRGVFNFSSSTGANFAYNMYALGGGVDIAVHRRINVRADYEYQKWSSFVPNGLTPNLITIGVAYHFPSGNLSAR